ncbi:MAG: hypothetical protein ACLUIX_05120 [Oscillospiraceae bacterium]
MTSKQTHSDASGSRRMAWMDWFGLIALGLLMVCSLVLLGQLLNLDMLDNKYLLLLMVGILILNGGHAVVPLPAAPPRVVMPPRSAARAGCDPVRRNDLRRRGRRQSQKCRHPHRGQDGGEADHRHHRPEGQRPAPSRMPWAIPSACWKTPIRRTPPSCSKLCPI